MSGPASAVRAAEEVAAAPPERSGCRPRTRWPTALRASPLVLGAPGAGVLAVLAYLGMLVRPVADDYCFAERVRDWGAAEFATTFYTRESGRALSGLLLAPFYLDPLPGLQIFPAVLIALAAASTAVVLRTLLPTYGARASAFVVLSATAAVAAVVLAGIANPYQSVLWTPGAVTHTVPALLAAALLTTAVRLRSTRVGCALAVAGTFVLGLGSEVLSLVVLAGTAAALLLRTALLRRVDGLALRLLAAAGGAGAALVAVLLSPASRRRQEARDSAEQIGTAALGDVVRQTAELVGTWLTSPGLLALVLVGLVVALSSGRAPAAPGGRRQRVLLAVLPGLLALAACAATVAALRAGYGPNGYRTARAYGTFWPVTCSAAVAYGLMLGSALRSRVARARPAVPGLIAVVAATAALACNAAVVERLLDLGRAVEARAASWDRQDAAVRRDLLAGVREPEVAPLPIGGLSVPYTRRESRDWVRDCIEGYYQVERIVPPRPQ